MGKKVKEPMQHDHPYDVCKCGDYRRDHKDGGACMWNNTELGHAGGDRRACTKFRFASPAVIGGNYHRLPMNLSED